MLNVNKLDTIEMQQNNIFSRLSMIESKITENKKLIGTANHNIYDIEKSQKFIRDKYDTVNQISTVNKGEWVKLQNEIKSMGSIIKKFKSDNDIMSENIITCNVG